MSNLQYLNVYMDDINNISVDRLWCERILRELNSSEQPAGAVERLPAGAVQVQESSSLHGHLGRFCERLTISGQDKTTPYKSLTCFTWWCKFKFIYQKKEHFIYFVYLYYNLLHFLLSH